MTRVEAVARAIQDFYARGTAILAGNVVPKLEISDGAAKQIAQAAIEANDAWLAERELKAVPREPNEAMFKAAGYSFFDRYPHEWRSMWLAAPEHPDD